MNQNQRIILNYVLFVTAFNTVILARVATCGNVITHKIKQYEIAVNNFARPLTIITFTYSGTTLYLLSKYQGDSNQSNIP